MMQNHLTQIDNNPAVEKINNDIGKLEIAIYGYWRHSRQSSCLTDNDNVVDISQLKSQRLAYVRNKSLQPGSADNPLGGPEDICDGISRIEVEQPTKWSKIVYSQNFAGIDDKIFNIWIANFMHDRVNPATDKLIFKKLIAHIKEQGQDYVTSQSDDDDIHATVAHAYTEFKQRTHLTTAPCLVVTPGAYRELKLHSKFILRDLKISEQQNYQGATAMLEDITAQPMPVYKVSADYLNPYAAIILDKNMLAWVHYVDVLFKPQPSHRMEQEIEIILAQDTRIVHGLDGAIQAIQAEPDNQEVQAFVLPG